MGLLAACNGSGRPQEEDTGIGPLPGTAGSGTADGSGDTRDPDDTGGTADGGTATNTNGDTTVGGDAQLQYLAVTPADTVLELDLDTPAAQDFTVTGFYSDGSSADLTAEATWSHSNATLGLMNGPTLEIPAFADTYIGSTVITAEAQGFFGFDQAQDLDAFEASVDTMALASFNFVAATSDAISYRSSPIVPDRGDRYFAPMKWEKRYLW